MVLRVEYAIAKTKVVLMKRVQVNGKIKEQNSMGVSQNK